MSGTAINYEGLETAMVGEVLGEHLECISRADLVAYAAASGDQNPIHQDEEIARSVGLPDVIAHGMFTMGLAGSMLEAIAGERTILSFRTRFASPLVVARDVSVELAITAKVQARDATANTVTLEADVSASGTKVLTRTRAVIQLD